MGLAKTAGGIIVPDDVLDALTAASDITTNARAHGFDLDGRRRITLTRDETKILDRVIRLMQPFGIGLVYCCTTNSLDDYQNHVCPNGCDLDQVGDLKTRAKGCTDEHPGGLDLTLKPGAHKKCGGVIVPEDRDTADPGYGCKCTRIHIQQSHGPTRRR